MNKMTNVLVLNVGAPPGRNVARTLIERKNIKVFVADTDPLVPILYNTSEINGSYVLPRADAAEYIKALSAIVIKEKIKVIIPCIEDEILGLSKYKDYFSKMSVAVLCVEYKKVIKIADKKIITDIAGKMNIPVPRTYILKDFVDEKIKMSFPLVVKPRIGHGAKETFMLKDRKGFKLMLYQLSEDANNYIIQQYIPGDVGSMFLCGLLYGRDGGIKAEFMSRSIKTLYSFGGPAVSGETIKGFSRLKVYSRKIIDAVGNWYGPVGIEYKISSEDGTPYFLDANPRFWGYGLLAVKSGIDFPYISVMDAIGQSYKAISEDSDVFVLLREHKDTVIPKSAVQEQYENKTILVFEIHSKSKKNFENIAKLRGVKGVDRIIITGMQEALKPFLKYINNKDEKLSCYTKQVMSEYENLYEIGTYNFAGVLVYLEETGKDVEINMIKRELKAFLGTKRKVERVNKDEFFIATNNYLKRCVQKNRNIDDEQSN